MRGMKYSGRHVVSTVQIALAVMAIALIAAPQAQAQLTCDPTPLAGCKSAGKMKFGVHNDEVVDSKDAIKWSWRLGELTTTVELGNPITTDEYVLCIYDGRSGTPTLLSQLTAPTGLLWRPKGNKGFGYKDKTRSNDGLQNIRLRAGDNGRAKMLVKARGGVIPMWAPFTPLAMFEGNPSVIVNLVNSQGWCWGSEFPFPLTARKNTRTDFKGNAP
jgi:hypothetical protein